MGEDDRDARLADPEAWRARYVAAWEELLAAWRDSCASGRRSWLDPPPPPEAEPKAETGRDRPPLT